MRSFISLLVLALSTPAFADEWKHDSAWHDGLVEKAVYAAARPIYGRDRQYDAIMFTNKEQHDRRTLTKATGSTDTVEVFKHNQIEVVPTPNYDYKFTTTTHLTVATLDLTRLDCSSQEFCGTSFKQFQRKPGAKQLEYWSFSYMPENGRVSDSIELRGDEPTVPQDGLSLWLRNYDFAARKPQRFWLLPTQKITRNGPFLPVAAEARYGGDDRDAHRIDVFTFAPTKRAGTAWDQDSRPLGTLWFAKDRLHVMVRAKFEDGQSYELKSVDRVDYWTINAD